MGKIVKKFKLNNKEVIFRYPKIEDVNSLLKLINSLVKEKAYISVQKKQTPKKEMYWLFEKLKRIDTKRNIILLLEIEGEIKGLSEIERFSRVIPGSHIGELEIILSEDIRREGFGKFFLTTIIKEAKKILKIKIIFIDVAKSNKIALNFYQKFGFRIVGKIRRGFKHYGKYLDDIILVKYLK